MLQCCFSLIRFVWNCSKSKMSLQKFIYMQLLLAPSWKEQTAGSELLGFGLQTRRLMCAGVAKKKDQKNPARNQDREVLVSIPPSSHFAFHLLLLILLSPF